ncbi:MAG: GNAT family N-acetyltransferase [Acidobacteria bacterium]|nr:GNAT family N-acetyltransferase [Acidobacteriota bacterium]
MNDLRLEIRHGIPALHALAEDWRTLYRATHAVPFLSWEWAVTWQKWFGTSKEPYLLCVYAGQELVGLLALVRESQQRLRRFAFLGSGFGGADYLDVLTLPGAETQVAELLREHLMAANNFDLLELDDLAADSIAATHFGTTQMHGFACPATVRYQCPQIQLQPDWNAVLKRSRRADNFKRRLRQVSARAGFAHHVVTDVADAVPAFERFLRLHDARWVNAGGSEMTGHDRLTGFHRELVVRLAEAGLLRFDELWVEGECRASIYGLEHGRRYYFYNSGYDQAWRSASVGLVLLGLSIKSAVERGIEVYDFLRGTEEYKFDWADTTRATVMLRLAPKHPRAALLLAYERTRETLQQGVRDSLPDWVLLPVQRARRAWKRAQAFKAA